MPELCGNCGHELPNAVGPGLYCVYCGEPVRRPERKQRVEQNENIKLEYALRVNVGENTYYCPDGATVFMDEHKVQWVKFRPTNGYYRDDEHMVRTDLVMIVRVS